jgi:hypothetical protein
MARKKFIWITTNLTNYEDTKAYGSLKKAKADTPNEGYTKPRKLEVVYGEGRKPKPTLAAPPAPTQAATQ